MNALVTTRLPDRQWAILYDRVSSLRRRITPADDRYPVVTSLLRVLRAQDTQSNPVLRTALWDSACLLAGQLCGRWN